ncbi:hypothetical protein [Limobrevibacterium gyesilva]|uniref:Nitrogen fixation protein n=1 Tax=Limobrevibacterium gyesilva TaxID=2991712 RepID=A0AA42CIY3_9PROT|nr:hypothetical protein [Limobrevibacterium gyesilva]MCW3476402.1 hypothetical protein [Limobrevibacterium gyesilva]
MTGETHPGGHALPGPAKLCPSAQPDMQAATVLGVVEGSPDAPRLSYLVDKLPVSDDVLAMAGSVKPTEVFRFAARCDERGCRHFDGANCQLATRIATMLDPVVDALPPCTIRPTCRWHAQEGRAACLRCPQVVTETATPSERYRAAAIG